MIIKVCGMREPDNIRDVANLDINLMGFIFYPKSPRYVMRERAWHYKVMPWAKPKGVNTVGVYVDEMPQTIITHVYNYDLDYVQLHGHESPVLIDNLRATLDPDIHAGIKFIKALSISSAADLEQCKAYEGHADLFLFDTRCPSYGGSGKQFDWDVLDAYHSTTPYLLSGGVSSDDAERAIDFVSKHPQCIGIDLNSNFEDAPAMKNVEKLDAFIKQLRQRQI